MYKLYLFLFTLLFTVDSASARVILVSGYPNQGNIRGSYAVTLYSLDSTDTNAYSLARLYPVTTHSQGSSHIEVDLINHRLMVYSWNFPGFINLDVVSLANGIEHKTTEFKLPESEGDVGAFLSGDVSGPTDVNLKAAIGMDTFKILGKSLNALDTQKVVPWETVAKKYIIDSSKIGYPSLQNAVKSKTGETELGYPGGVIRPAWKLPDDKAWDVPIGEYVFPGFLLAQNECTKAVSPPVVSMKDLSDRFKIFIKQNGSDQWQPWELNGKKEYSVRTFGCQLVVRATEAYKRSPLADKQQPNTYLYPPLSLVHSYITLRESLQLFNVITGATDEIKTKTGDLDALGMLTETQLLYRDYDELWRYDLKTKQKHLLVKDERIVPALHWAFIIR